MGREDRLPFTLAGFGDREVVPHDLLHVLFADEPLIHLNLKLIVAILHLQIFQEESR